MPAPKRLCKKPTSYKLPVDIEVLLHNAVESGEYNNTSDAITAALRFFFQHRDIKQVKDEVAVLQSEILLLNNKNQILELIDTYVESIGKIRARIADSDADNINSFFSVSCFCYNNTFIFKNIHGDFLI